MARKAALIAASGALKLKQYKAKALKWAANNARVLPNFGMFGGGFNSNLLYETDCYDLSQFYLAEL
jgi:hypothetical protein